MMFPMSDAPVLIEKILDGFGSYKFLDAGYSVDRKYLVDPGNGTRLLLRISPLEFEKARQFEFSKIGDLRSQGVRCPEVIQFGTVENICFCLYTYIEGIAAEEALPKMTLSEQCQFGFQSGQELKKIHDAFVGPEVDERGIREAKFRKYSARLTELGMTYAGREVSEEFVNRNIHRLEGRPSTFRHGDYHPGNLIAEGSIFSGVIDFNRCDWGDPFDDFYKTAFFGAPVSPHYANGLIKGYFECEPQPEFWLLYNLYVAATLPADLVWAESLFPHLISEAMERVGKITSTHDFVEGGPPQWWERDNEYRSKQALQT